jgi:hypothetical protein
MLVTDNADLKAAITEHVDTIKSETLANSMYNDIEKTHQDIVKVEGATLTVGIQKA